MVRTHDASRFHIDGPDVRLSANQAVPLSLALHELATNALKYGALTGVTGGHVRLSWNLSYDNAGGRHLTLLWAEVDGPLVSPPTVEGFGARLLARIFAPAGEALLTYPPEGVRCTITLALSSPDELPRMDVEGDPRRKA